MVAAGRRSGLFTTIALLVLGTAATKAEEGSLPLEPGRTVEFQVEEGTWLSLDLSPEGRTLVFELLGDLYELDIAGGRAKRVLGGLAFETQPAYSPDGLQIAFLSDRSGSENLWIAARDGSLPRQVSFTTDGGNFASPAWSPDGSHIYVSRAGVEPDLFRIWAYDVRGGSGFALEEVERKSGPPWYASADHEAGSVNAAPAQNALGAAPSPDGRHLYYSSKSGGFAAGSESPAVWQLMRRDLAQGTVDVLAAPTGGAMRPILSPDGRSLVYATRVDTETTLRIRDLVSGADRLLLSATQPHARYEVPSRDLMPGSAFTPDGRALITTFGGKIQRVEVGTGAARVIPFTADVSLEIGSKVPEPRWQQPPTVRARVIQAPRQSPDGRQLAFSAFAQLHVMPPARRRGRAPPTDEFHAARVSAGLVAGWALARLRDLDG